MDKNKSEKNMREKYTILHAEFPDMKEIKFLFYMRSRICYINQACEEKAVLEGHWIDG